MEEFINFYTTHLYSFLFTIAIISLFIGSFLNVVIYRLPRMIENNWSEECRHYLGLHPDLSAQKLNLTLPFSHCPACKASIRPWHNIPIISYLFLRGRCANCHAPISLRYPFVEALTMILSVIVAYRFGVTLETLAALFFTWIAITLTFIDIDHHLLPDQLTLLLLWLGLFFSLFNLFSTPQDAILGAISGYLIFALVQIVFRFLTHKTGMGQGDYKYLAGLGAFLGWQLLPLIILFASVSGVILTFFIMILKRQMKSEPLPFGPYLALAGFIALLWGDHLMHFYLQTMF